MNTGIEQIGHREQFAHFEIVGMIQDLILRSFIIWRKKKQKAVLKIDISKARQSVCNYTSDLFLYFFHFLVLLNWKLIHSNFQHRPLSIQILVWWFYRFSHSTEGKVNWSWFYSVSWTHRFFIQWWWFWFLRWTEGPLNCKQNHKYKSSTKRMKVISCSYWSGGFVATSRSSFFRLFFRVLIFINKLKETGFHHIDCEFNLEWCPKMSFVKTREAFDTCHAPTHWYSIVGFVRIQWHFEFHIPILYIFDNNT